ncbi:MAG: hypothetical protein ACLS3C_10810 [Oscillospiraceae bacterium]
MKQENFVENIPGILLLSHGPFCQALLESAQMIGGEAVNARGAAAAGEREH